jgi:PPOX class probable F420-dependent enzyme
MDESTMRRRAAAARAGRLATVRRSGSPHVVVCCFVLDGDTVYSAVDDKPKRSDRLQRLENVRANSSVSLLIDHYEEDWSKLWWIRIDGSARVVGAGREQATAASLLSGKYEQYRTRPPAGPVIAITVTRWSAWP